MKSLEMNSHYLIIIDKKKMVNILHLTYTFLLKILELTGKINAITLPYNLFILKLLITTEIEQNNAIMFFDLKIFDLNTKHHFSIFHNQSHRDIKFIISQYSRSNKK